MRQALSEKQKYNTAIASKNKKYKMYSAMESEARKGKNDPLLGGGGDSLLSSVDMLDRGEGFDDSSSPMINPIFPQTLE